MKRPAAAGGFREGTQTAENGSTSGVARTSLSLIPSSLVPPLPHPHPPPPPPCQGPVSITHGAPRGGGVGLCFGYNDMGIVM